MQKGNNTQSPAVKPGEENNVSNTETKNDLEFRKDPVPEWDRDHHSLSTAYEKADVNFKLRAGEPIYPLTVEEIEVLCHIL